MRARLPLVLTALNLANHVELFSAELRPLTQQSSPLGDYGKSFFPKQKNQDKPEVTDTHMGVVLVVKLCLLENAKSSGWQQSAIHLEIESRRIPFPSITEQKCQNGQTQTIISPWRHLWNLNSVARTFTTTFTTPPQDRSQHSPLPPGRG